MNTLQNPCARLSLHLHPNVYLVIATKMAGRASRKKYAEEMALKTNLMYL